uniref:Uncharacterized protein n=1 Tax=Romanomermis culicivorax TaxID=13658 RepID=A0A915L612_ROMCU
MSDQSGNYLSFNNVTQNSVLSNSPPNDSRIRTRFGGSSSHKNYAATCNASISNNGHCCNGFKSTSDLPGTSSAENVGRQIGKKPTMKARFYDPWNEFSLGLFFEALKQFGKDFDQIHNYFQQKCKQQNAKNYAQIKTFYRRTWLKLSTKLNLPENGNIPKDAREIFGMIAYGELIKRAKNLKMTSPDFSVILSGLVLNGFTVVRIRVKIRAKNAETNKNRTSTGAAKLPKRKIRIVKIKMPQCPALTKFFDKNTVLSENHVLTKESTNMPKSVVVELVPKTYGDRAYVLTHCKQNPQIKFNLALNQPISEVLIWLKRKWLPEDQRTLLQCQVESPNTDEFCWPDITIFPSNNIRLSPVSIYPLINENSSQSNVTTLYGLKQCFNLISGDEAQENNRSTNNDFTSVNDAPTKTQSVDQEPVQNCVVQSDGTKLTFCPRIIQNGLSLENCGGLTAGQLCLTCCRSPVLRFVYTIKSKIRDMDTASPVWQCFLRLIQHNFFELLNDSMPNLNQTAERYDINASAVAEEIEPQQNVQIMSQNFNDGFAVPENNDNYYMMKRKISKAESNFWATVTSTPIFVENVEQQPIVASETQAFLMQYKKIREDAAAKQKKRYTTSRSGSGRIRHSGCGSRSVEAIFPGSGSIIVKKMDPVHPK